jgi:phosphonopyruvate decarboxylase
MTQAEFLSQLSKDNPEAVLIGSIGTISYDLTEIEHKEKILVRGAMGSVLGIGLGYALNTDKQVIVVIGDGSFLMQMGAMSTILKHNLPNLRVIILNNKCYKSCGGQSTNFDSIKSILPFQIEEF